MAEMKKPTARRRLSRFYAVVDRVMSDEGMNPALGDALDEAMSGAVVRAAERERPLQERKVAAHSQRQQERERAQRSEPGQDSAALNASQELAAQQQKAEVRALVHAMTPEERELVHMELVERASEDERVITPEFEDNSDSDSDDVDFEALAYEDFGDQGNDGSEGGDLEWVE